MDQAVLYYFIVMVVLFGSAFIFLLIHMFREASRTTVEEEELRFENLPAAFHGLRLFFISDIHRRTVDDKLTTSVERLGGADFVLIGGDLRERGVPLERTRANIRELAKIGPVYMVTGNHDYDDNVRELDVLLQEERVQLLSNDHVLLEQHDGSLFKLAGVDDPRTYRDQIDAALSGMHAEDPFYGRNTGFTLLAAHDPAIAERLTERAWNEVDLILSGHTHGGQIRIPLLNHLVYNKEELPYLAGVYELKRKAQTGGGGRSIRLFVSRGYGTSKLPLRLLAPPQTHLITLKRIPE